MVVPLALCACGEVKTASPDALPLPDGSEVADAAPDAVPDAAPDAEPPGPGDWGVPTPLEGMSEPSVHEESPTVTADGLELFFLRLDATGFTTWVARRASRSDPWNRPQLAPSTADRSIEVSPDGLELFTSRGGRAYAARRAARDAAWSTTTPVAFDAVASRVTTSDDGLTAYYHAPAPALAVVRRERSSTTGAWSEPLAGGIEYPRNTPDGVTPDHYRCIDVRGDVMLLSTPTRTMSGLPRVAEMRRVDGAWSAYRAVPRMVHLECCELVSETEAICGADTDGDKAADDLVRVTKEVQP
jgi:hypothetical protein